MHANPPFPFATPPRWYPSSQRFWGDLPSDLADWLLNHGSLTQRLRCACAGRFRVRVLRQGWSRPARDEARILGSRLDAWAWTREVQLLCDEQPWVFARSVAARSALEGSGLALDQLGSRSLGELLFSDRAFQRGELQVTRYPAGWLPVAVRSEQLWARRSCFRRGELAVLVAEVFLPELWRAAARP